MKQLKCHKGIGPVVEGVALVAQDNFSARYDLDRIKGVFSRPQHALAGQSYDGKILVLNTAKGGVASAWMLHEMKSRGITPRAMPREPSAIGTAPSGSAVPSRWAGSTVVRSPWQTPIWADATKPCVILG